MLAKPFKLTGKDVRFLLRKRGLVYGKGMAFAVFPQYAGKEHNQRSLQVSTKVSKKSVDRNMIKRLFYDQLAVDLPIGQKLADGYYKIFAYFHKSMPEELVKLLANDDKTTIKNQIKAHFHEHFTSFPDLICRFSDLSKKSGTSLKKRPPTSKPLKEKN